MSDKLPRSVARLAEGLAAGEYSSVELTRPLSRPHREPGRPQLNSFITVCAEQALAEAAAADAAARPARPGP
jgi:aspartyl-tRNA(Asn)/glutamyl-tRNA(Gln) amidotransferase subunit A